MKSYKYTLEGLDCAACAKKVEDEIANTEGYKDVVVNFSTLKLTFKTNKPNPKKEITKLVQKLEPDIEVLEDGEENHDKEEHNGNDIARIVVGIAIYLIAIIGKFNTTVTSVLTIIAFAILLYKTAKKGFKQLFKNKVLDENMLIVVSAIGAYLVGKNSEGLMVITLYEIGKILESKAVNKTRKSISELMNIKPEYANLKQGEEWKQVTPDKVKIGDVILVKTGEKIPLDGIVIKGNAQIDNSALTGESKLLEVAENSKVLSGSINTNGLIEVKVEQTYENSTVSQILNLVENATDKKAKTETFVSKAAKIYTPVVMGLALLVAIFMPLIIAGVTYKESIYKALIFLVISCPCSIAISVPLSYFSGIGKASKKGILIKGSDYLDGIKDIKEIIFDKTGTLTQGEFRVARIKAVGMTEEELLKLVAHVESYSNHPLAKSLADAYGKELDTDSVRSVKEKPGFGISATYEGQRVHVGSRRMMDAKKLLVDEINEPGTVVYVCVGREYAGYVLVQDQVKEEAKATLTWLKEKYRAILVMLTGDTEKTGRAVGRELHMDYVYTDLLPQDKLEQLEDFMSIQGEAEKLVCVGDGINDAPMLARADIGIAMGNLGSEAAIEAADVILVKDDLHGIVALMKIAKETLRSVSQNITFAVFIKILVLFMAVIGYFGMWEAILVEMVVVILAVINSAGVAGYTA